MKPSPLLRTLACLGLCSPAVFSSAQLSTFAGNGQHTNVFSQPAANVNRVIWQTPIDTSNSGAFAHYGEPLITPNNTVIVPVLTSTSTVTINAFDGATGTFKYNLATNYVMPAHSWIPEYSPVIYGSRLYYPGAGGTVYYVDNIDGTPTPPTQLCFYGLPTYSANVSGFNSTVFVDTPLTADSQGNIFFGFRMQGTPISPFTANGSGQPLSGYARIAANGTGSYVLVNAMTGDQNIAFDSHNAAPALSNDESTIYVLATQYNNSFYAYICGLDSTTLATKYKKFITNPQPFGTSAGPVDDSTASPMVAPDGDVYMGMFVSPYNGSRGYLAHYSSDLSTIKTPGAFGWDFTPGIVPASMVPSYHGKSSYLLFCKYNNYADTGRDDGGDEINTVAILDPNDETQTDWHPQAAGMTEMREVLTMIGPTPNNETPELANSVREWCVNATAVNPATDSVFFNSEDGKAYRWNLTQNSLAQCITLTTGFGVPYVPSFVGPDGTAYTFNGTFVFAMGPVPGVSETIDSDHADARNTVVGDNVTFTANVTDPGATQASTVTFTDVVYDNLNPISTTLGTAALVNGHASISTSTLKAGSYNAGADIYLGSHFITATYNRDGTNATSSIMRVQKIHWYPSQTGLQVIANPTNYGQPVTLTATVSGPQGAGTPTAMLTFLDGSKVLGQKRLDSSGSASVTVNNLSAGGHDFSAVYVGDTEFASSSIHVQGTVSDGTTTSLGLAPNPSNFGQQVAMTATVTSVDNGAGTPTGSVQFSDGPTILGTSQVDGNGIASLGTSALPPGHQVLTATFTGTNGWGGSAGQNAQVVVENTQTQLSGAPNPSAFGQSVQFTASVSSVDGGAGTPSGSITFAVDGNNVSSGPIDGSGHATYSTSTLPAGVHQVTAAFTGLQGWNASNGVTSQTVTDGTTTTVSGSPNPSNFSQGVAFTATVAPVDAGAGAPSGNVTFSDGANVLGTSPVDATGHAFFTTSSLSIGDHTINAAFNSLQGWGPSNAQTAQHVQEPTNSSLASSANPSNFNHPVTFNATVAANNPSAGSPVGSVTFSDSGNPLGTVPLDAGGHASFGTSSLSFGTHTITATFNPTGGWLPSSSQVSQSIEDDTTTALGSTPNPSSLGQSVTLTATIRAADSGAGTPVGQVAFTADGVTNLGSSPVDGTGHASVSTSSLTAGSHSISAMFTGVPGWHLSSGSTSQVVNGDTTPPTVPQGVSATSGPAKGQITVRWSASTDPDDAVNHYEIWKSNKVNGSYALLTTTASFSVVDSAGHNQSRSYYIIAVDSHGNKSAPSAKVTAKGL